MYLIIKLMNWTEIIGLAAGTMTTAAIIPQIKKAYGTKNVDDISPYMFMVMIGGVGLWTVYGIIKKDFPIILFNGICFVLNLCLLYLVFKYKGNKQQ